MGTFEKESAKRKKKKDIQRIVLTTVALTGALSVALVAPNALGAMAKLGLIPTKRQKESIDGARDRLIRKRLLRKNEQGLLCVTPLGERELLKMQIRKEGLPRPKRWDGRWRVLIFDIPDYRRGLRAKVRRNLHTAGFVLLQKSVWVYPYDCEDFIALLKADFKIGKDMRYIIADTIEGDGIYRKQFDLLKR